MRLISNLDEALRIIKINPYNSVDLSGFYFVLTKSQFRIVKDWGGCTRYYAKKDTCEYYLKKYTYLSLVFSKRKHENDINAKNLEDFYPTYVNHSNRVLISDKLNVIDNDMIYLTIDLISLVKLRELVEDYGERIVKLILRDV